MFIGATYVQAQDYASHNWYFGNNNLGIRFNRSDNAPSLVVNNATSTPGGAAVATNSVNGNLLFYSDGQNIYDASHQVMFGATPLGGNPNGNQAVAIAKVPGEANQYYVFVNTADGTTPGAVNYFTVDMSRTGNATFPSPPLGEMIASNGAVPGVAGVSEAMITVPSAGDDFFLITHANGSPDFFVTRFTSTGTPTTAPQEQGVGLIEVASNFAWNGASGSAGRIAVSTQEISRDIEIVIFNNLTGELKFDQRILNTAVSSNTTGEAIFDTEWSPNGQYLYISRHGDTGVQADLLQADVTNALTTHQRVLTQNIARSYGLQLAPDRRIYHLYQETAGGPFLVGVINRPDTIAAAVNYNPEAFTGSPDFAATQFSSFSLNDTIPLTVTFTTDGTCANTPIAFYPTVEPDADSLVWSFGDGTGGAGWSPVHIYESGGAFNVTVRAYLGTDSADFSQVVNITAFDLQLTLVQDTTACKCELPINNGVDGCPNDTSDDMVVTVQVQDGTGAESYQWYGPGGPLPGQTTNELRPDSAGYYYVVVTIGACSTYAGVNIKEYDVQNQQANIWHFGMGAGIDFNPLPDGPPVPINGWLNTPEGTSVICDQNGLVILSTDGRSVYTRGPGGAQVDITPALGLGGDPESTQSALIVPVSGDETLYYIFTTQAVDGPTGAHELRYSLFDLKRNDGVQNPFIIAGELLFARSTERITSNGNWLIAHEFGNNSFRAYRVDAQGIGNPVISAIGSDHTTTTLAHGQGYMEIGAQNRIAVALSTPGVSNVVEIFDFIDSTGVVSNFRVADLNTATGQVYGIELFGDKLYASLTDANSAIYEFAFDSLGNPYLKQQQNYPGEALGAMQIGPDGTIYVARQGSANLWTFQPVADTAQLTPLTTLQDFALLGGTNSGLGLPNFTQIVATPIQEPSFTATTACLHDSTTFTATGKDSAIDMFTWSITGVSGIQEQGPQLTHVFDLEGTYTVTVGISNRCETQLGNDPYIVFDSTLTVNPLPAIPVQTANLCQPDDVAVLDANPNNTAGLTYIWSTGDTTRTITVTSPAIYGLTLTDALGCTNSGDIFVTSTRPTIELGSDVTICAESAFGPLDAGTQPNITYTWFVNDAENTNTSSTQSVDTSTPGQFEYKVRLEADIDGQICASVDSVIIDIMEIPTVANLVVTPTSSCGAGDAGVSFDVTGPTNTLLTYSVTGPFDVPPVTNQTAPFAASTPTTLSAGVYVVSVTDQISGCSFATTATVNDPEFSVAGVPTADCDPIMIQTTITPNPPSSVTTPFTFRVLDAVTAAVVQDVTNESNLTFNTAALPSNNQEYLVQVSAGACVATSPPITVNQEPTVPATFQIDACNDPITITATGGTTWNWSGPEIIGATTGYSISASPDQGAHVYNVRITQTGFCALDTMIVVDVDNDWQPVIQPSDPCADLVVLTATPSGPEYTYQWTRNGQIFTNGTAQILIGRDDDGANFGVTVINSGSGCVKTSTHNANVAGELNVVLGLDNVACQGTPFLLVATATPPDFTGPFVWTYNGGTQPTTTAQHTDEREGEYLVSITRSGCTVTDEMTVVPGPITPGLLLSSYLICPDDPRPDAPTRTVTLDAGPGFISYQWYVDGQLQNGATERTFTADDVGTYRVEMVNPFGCPSADETEVARECDPRITGPNAFRPSGVNQEFFLYTFFVADEDFQVFIFNRWGEMVFQANNRDFRWNGGYNNNSSQPLPPGTYTYVVKYKGIDDDRIRETRGGVVLLR